MGWNTANQIFDPVAQALIDAGASDELKTRVLGKLIGQLQEGDWDTGDESLDQFKNDPAIRAAFRQYGVVVLCDAETPEQSCDRETGHDGDCRDWQGEPLRQAVAS